MGLELHVKVERHAVCFAGETLACQITIRNPPPLQLPEPSSPRHPLSPVPLRKNRSSDAPFITKPRFIDTTSSPGSLSGPGAQTPTKVSAARAMLGPKLRAVSHSAGGLAETEGTESILWAFVQVVGSFVVDDRIIENDLLQETLSSVPMYQASGASAPGTRRPTTSAQPNSGGGLFPTQNTSSWIPSSARSVFGQPPDPTAGASSWPIFSTPPSLLFCDMILRPGDGKAFKYEIKLPDSLPPTHRGKALHLSYRLIISVQHSAPSLPPAVANIPFRVFNLVAVDGSRPAHDLLEPHAVHKDRAIIMDVDSIAPLPPTPISASRSTQSHEGRMRFFRSVLDAVRIEEEAKASGPPKSPMEFVFAPADAGSSLLHAAAWCYRSRPATYTLAYGDGHVGRVRLPRSNHRLGEPVSGVLDLGDAQLACYHVTITLESLERVEPAYALLSPRQIQERTRERHAQHHQRCHMRRRIGFSLQAPSWASADFETTIGSLGWQLRFEFIIGPPQPPGIRSRDLDDGWREDRAPEEVPVESFECAVPIRMYACGYAAGKCYPDDVTIPLKASQPLSRSKV